ncbi:MAG: RluA family pseudouridine synthase, partial [Planctomycetales bacterium]|nr:RluA family pseudouridine synthase [Planctomycetales bacterium]
MEQLVDVLFEDDSIVVVNKPSGILTQAPPGIDSLEVRIREYLRWKHRLTGDIYVGVPHRLDRPVSGAMVFARRRKHAHRLSKQFERREVGKTYWAIVEGTVADDSGTLRDYMRKIPGRAFSEAVDAEHPDAKIAIQDFRVRKRFATPHESTWLEIELATGRTHQIRV